jgi:hypothetical protein
MQAHAETANPKNQGCTLPKLFPLQTRLIRALVDSTSD